MYKLFVFFLLIAISVNAQINDTEDNSKKNNHYLEDQIYTGVTYNIINKLPGNIRQSGFSNSIFIGFIKDIPFNKLRNKGIGIGIGYDMATYFQNLKIYENDNQLLFENFGEDESFKNNKFVLHSIEVPFELRLRTSTRKEYKFWRLYTGVKAKYIIYSKAAYKNDNTQKITNIKAFDKFNYGLTLSAGNSTWNVHFYYGLKPIIKDALFNNTEKIKMKDFKVGLIFYIL